MFRLVWTPALRDWLLWAALMVFAAGSGYALWNNPEGFAPDPARLDSDWLVIPGCLVFLVLGYLLILDFLAFRYRPVPPSDDAGLPECTVIVPAYNEGRHVSDTLNSLLHCDYPAEKLEIIAIDDGSKDDTWHWIQCSAEAAKGRITIVRLPENGGKKHALYHGMKAARHPFIATLDSDSIIAPDGLRQLLAPFRDARVGAVAGNILVKHPEAGFISSMLDVTLVFGCEFLRAAQSMTGSVFCTPGALSAYRKSAVAPLLDIWLGQTFLGEPSRIGEDRAIATLLLQSGHRIVHQGSARVATCVPNTYCGLCKMLLRWTRSDIRENLLMSRFIGRNLPPRGFRNWVLLLHWMALMLNVLLPFLFVPFFFFMLFCGALHPAWFLAGNLAFALLWASIPGLIYARRTSLRQAVWALLYGIFCPFAISWICIYAFLTLRNSQWLTRELAAASPEQPLELPLASGNTGKTD